MFIYMSGSTLLWTGSAFELFYLGNPYDMDDPSYGYELYHQSVGTDGEPLGPPVFFTPPSLFDEEPGGGCMSAANSLGEHPFAVMYSLRSYELPMFLNFVDVGGGAVHDPGLMLADDTFWCDMQSGSEDGFAALYNTHNSGQHLVVLDSEGEVLNDVVFQYDETYTLFQCARVVADDDGYTLFWFVTEDLPMHIYELWMRRFDALGDPVTEPVRLLEEEERLNHHSFYAAFTGSTFGLVFHECDIEMPSKDLKFAVVDREGRTVESPRVLGMVKQDDRRAASIAWTGSEFGIGFTNLVSWEVPESPVARIRFTRLDEEGTVLGEPVDVMGGEYYHFVRAVWNGSLYGLSWTDRTGYTAASRLYFAVLGCTPPP